jgi:hypothetical protein
MWDATALASKHELSQRMGLAHIGTLFRDVDGYIVTMKGTELLPGSRATDADNCAVQHASKPEQLRLGQPHGFKA